MSSLPISQISRDIDWIQTSPSIISSDYEALFIDPLKTKAAPWSCRPEDYHKLIDTLSRRRQHLLGIYYETLWQQVLDKQPDTELIASNLQVQADNRTLGEFDLIFKQNNKAVHRELAVKFYLGLPSETTEHTPWNHWVGPGLKDRLDRKLNRTLQHQITLGDTPEGKAALQKLGIESVKKEILLQGYLFYPYHLPCQPPIHSTRDHLRHVWLPFHLLSQWLADQPSNSVYLIQPKTHWLSAYQGSPEISQRYDSNRLHSHLQVKLHRTGEPLLIVCCQQNGNLLLEQDRAFVVPDDWEQKARLVI